jgi:hypothetical protein
LSSWAKKGYKVRLYSYGPLTTPPGVSVEDANEIVPEVDVFSNPGSNQSFAGFSNVFRYSLLNAKPDEVWIDCDVLAGPESLSAADYIFGFESKTVINGAVLRMPAFSPGLDALITHSDRTDKMRFRWGELGPKLITRVARDYGLERFAADQSVFYAIPALETWKFFSPNHAREIENRIAHSEGVHLWNEALKLSVVNPKTRKPPSGSFLEKQLREHSIEVNTNVELSVQELRHWRNRSRTQAFRNQVHAILTSLKLIR